MPTRLRLDLPGVWRAAELAGAAQPTLGTGVAALDQALPGGGWPLGQLTEVLQEHSGWHEWRLLLPVLRRVGRERFVVLVAPPHVPHLAALQVQGLPAQRVLWVQADTPVERLWAAEQALRCHEVGAVLAWLPQARPEQLRRLHLASQGAGAQALVFVFRPWQERHQSSPAPLRLGLGSQGPQGLELRIFKRRGPLLEQALTLAMGLPLAVAARHGAMAAPGPLPAEVVGVTGVAGPPSLVEQDSHAVDRPGLVAHLAPA
ncbi:MAG: translesion DNA synthesis-associated protein ImuA [Rhodoferax sp.]